MNNYCVYIISNWNNKVIYVGVTNNLQRRIYEHKNKLVNGFSKKYNLSKLVYFETTNDVNSAKTREKEIKKWRREKKNNLIESLNPEWKDLIVDIERKISQSNKKDILLRNDNPMITGLIIAAGFSSRMGTFKPLLTWNDKSFLSNIIDKLKPICNEIIIVTGNNSDLIEQHVREYYSNVESIKCVFNSDYEKGMFISLKKGIEYINETDWILFHQVDQPNLPKEFYLEFMDTIDHKYDWIQPRYKEKNGHPIFFNRNMMNLIKNEKSDGNLREISRSYEIKKKYWECKYSEIHTDIDTLKDLEKLKREEDD